MFVVTATAFLTHLSPEANVWRHERGGGEGVDALKTLQRERES